MKIAILGAGAFGTALGCVLQNNGHIVDYYDPFVGYTDLGEAIEGASYILVAVPSFAIKDSLEHLPTNIPLIIATKGLLDDSILKRFKDYMVLSGPSFANDINSKKPTELTTSDKRVAELLSNEHIGFDMTSDKKGIMLCGGLKNIYALYAGFLNLERDADDWQEYIDSAVGEMKSILELNGAQPGTVDLSCGRADLELTCGLPSRNYEFGVRLSNDETAIPDKTVEGLTSLDLVKAGVIELPSDLVILPEIIDKIQIHA